MRAALLAAVYLHGRAGELGAAKLGEKSLIATDLLLFLPEAMREVADHLTPNLKKRPSLWARRSRGIAARVAVLLIGNLGAGKTTLAKGIVKGLGAGAAG